MAVAGMAREHGDVYPFQRHNGPSAAVRIENFELAFPLSDSAGKPRLSING